MTKPKAPPPDDGANPAAIVLPLLNQFVEDAGDDFNVHDLSVKFRRMVEHEHPTAWVAYSEFHWTAHFEDVIRHRLAAIRSAARQSDMRSVARQRVNERVLTGMSTTSYAVNNSGRYKRLLAMTKGDLLSVAERYEKSASTSMKQAAFLRVVAKRLKADQTVGDAWTAAKIEAEARRIFGPQAGDVLDALDGAA